MKLRIRGDSVRLRLLKSEVEALATHGAVLQETGFGTTALRYGVSIAPVTGSITSSFENNEIVVIIPQDQARDWIHGRAVSLTAKQDAGDGRMLDILVEKDFVCLDRPDDPDSVDAFERPDEIQKQG